MAIKYTGNSIPNPSQVFPNYDFWYENIPSGNPAWVSWLRLALAYKPLKHELHYVLYPTIWLNDGLKIFSENTFFANFTLSCAYTLFTGKKVSLCWKLGRRSSALWSPIPCFICGNVGSFLGRKKPWLARVFRHIGFSSQFR
jgi:hypothetical protein